MYPSDPNPLIENSLLGSKFLNPDYLFSHGLEIFGYIFNQKALTAFNVFLSFLSIFFIAIILYCTVRMFEIRAKQHKHLKQEIAEYAHHQALQEREFREKEEISANERWIKVLNYLSSTNESDWKLAVIEADTMLEELMTQLGFKGENLGDKLKGADRENFRSLSSAWEVHIIRNKIAHEGASFNFSLREAKRVIALYEQIFREYGFI
ncbi:MAG: hypothetical protein UT09_C0009G0027 [Parcubacteria group bacterium GW2011_GWF2_38_8]|nr:MAG: hypothetical protein UT09_C0009G0027 [Parcubacteria group bacterium GW2011_GWF2_38_8]